MQSYSFCARACAALFLAGSLIHDAEARPVSSPGLKVAPGYRVRTVLETPPGKIAGGLTLDVDGYAMYAGSDTNIFKWEYPFGGSFAPFAAIPPNTDISALAAVTGDVFASSGTSFSSPFPHNLGRVRDGSYSNLFTLDGLFDASAAWSGDLFLVANPGGTGTQIFQYDAETASLSSIVSNGGWSGGMTFREWDGIYYADQNSGAIVRYADTNSGGIVPLDSPVVFPGDPQIDPNPQVVVSNAWGTYLSFDPKDRLLATTSFGNELRAFDRWSGAFLERIAWDGAGSYGIGQVAQNWWTREIVLVFTDWKAYRSKVVALRPFWTGNDTDGNHIANVVGFNARGAGWKIVAPETKTTNTLAFGSRGEQPVVGDFDGDGVGDLATRNVLTGKWNIRWSGPVIQASIYPPPGFSLPAGAQNIPCPADYNGDGTTDPAVYNKRTGLFTIGNSGVVPLEKPKAKTSIAPYPDVGIPGGIPVPGDYDGDGVAEKCVYIPGSGNWIEPVGGDALYLLGQWGWSGALPVQSDYDGDGKTDLATFESATCNWFILGSSNGAPKVVQFGYPGCVAAPADYDGDQKTDVAVYDPKTGNFYAFRTTAGFYTTSLGTGLQIVKP